MEMTHPEKLDAIIYIASAACHSHKNRTTHNYYIFTLTSSKESWGIPEMTNFLLCLNSTSISLRSVIFWEYGGISLGCTTVDQSWRPMGWVENVTGYLKHSPLHCQQPHFFPSFLVCSHVSYEIKCWVKYDSWHCNMIWVGYILLWKLFVYCSVILKAGGVGGARCVPKFQMV